MKYKVGYKYKRKMQINSSNEKLVLNNFKIIKISDIFVTIYGKNSSKLEYQKDINKKDFKLFLKNYKLIKNN